MLHSIEWPAAYTPGRTDNFVSNEIIIPELSAAQVWKYITDTREWEGYYRNVRDIRFYGEAGPLLAAEVRFRFTTFSFPVEAQVLEFVPPVAGQPGRLAWHGRVEGDADGALEAYHAWLFEDLPGDRVRILTQETQYGKPAREMKGVLPNPMLNAHQEWIEGLAKAALK